MEIAIIKKQANNPTIATTITTITKTKPKIASVGEYAEKLEPLCIAAGKWKEFSKFTT